MCQAKKVTSIVLKVRLSINRVGYIKLQHKILAQMLKFSYKY